jgi:lysophospholipase L1-like esterase
VAQRLALLVVVVIVEFAALEAGMRLVGGSEAAPAFQRIFMQDPRVGHRLQPGATTVYSTAEFSTALAINNQGVRDDADIGPKAPDEKRIVVLGDSLVLSVQVPVTATFSALLQDHLRAAPPDGATWRVINAGVQGYGPVEAWLFYKHVVSRLEPDLVVVVSFVGNDAIEAVDRQTWIDADGPPATSTTEAAVTTLRRIVRSSMVLQTLRLRMDQLRNRLVTPTAERPLASYLADPPAEVEEGLGVARRAVGLIADAAAADGAATALVLMPARFQLDDADFGRLRDATAAAGAELVRDAATDRFGAALAPLGLPMLDLLPVLRAQPDPVGLFFQRNIHLTPRGHRVVAEALDDFLRTQVLPR